MASTNMRIVIDADTAGAVSGVRKVSGAVDDLGQTTSKATRRTELLGAAATISKVGLLGLAFGAKKSLDAASGLNEQVSKNNAVFGESAPAIQAWAQTTAKSFGISRREALAATGTFGNMLIPLGTAPKEAATMSRAMVELAADMASFNDADPSQVLDDLRSGLAGESEPLRKYGISLNDARLKQEAMNLGLYNGKGALDASAKAQATYALILKDSKAAQGDFARTSDSLANSQRIQAATTEDVGASMGAALIPTAKVAMSVLAGLTAIVAEHTQAAQITVGVVAAVGVALIAASAAAKISAAATVLWTGATKAAAAAQWALNIAMRANPVVLAITALVALGAALVIAYKRSETFRNAVDAAFAVVKAATRSLLAAFEAVLSWVQGNWKKIALLISGPFAPLVALATDAFGIRSRLIAAFSAMLSAARSGMAAIVGAVRGAAGAATAAARSVGTAIVNGVKAGLAAIRSIYAVLWAGISGAVSAAASAALGAAAAIGRAIVSGALSGMSGLASAIRSAAQGAIRSGLSNLNPFSPVEHGGFLYIGRPIVEGALKGLNELGPKMKTKLTKAVREAVTSAKQSATSMASSLGSAIGTAIDATLGKQLSALGNSPEAQRLRAIEAQQKATQTTEERTNLQGAIDTARTPAERQEAVRAMDAWLLEQERQTLADSLAEKERVFAEEAAKRKTFAERGLTDLTDALNRGLITQAQYNVGLQSILTASGVDYANIGSLLGSSFATGFAEQVTALLKQVGIIAKGPKTAGGGVTFGVVSIPKPKVKPIKLPGRPDLPSFETGIARVPYDMTANIHAGEAVLDRREAAAWRSGNSSRPVAVTVQLSGGLEYLRELIEVRVDQMSEAARRRGLAAGAVR